MLEHSKNTSNCLVVILAILEVEAEDIFDLWPFTTLIQTETLKYPEVHDYPLRVLSSSVYSYYCC